MTYKRIFLDSNVLIDLLLSREPFCANARAIFDLSISTKLELVTSSLSFLNTHYILSGAFGKEKALFALGQARKLVDLISVGETHVDQALTNPGSDFEDAVQYFAAKSANCGCIISRDKKGFKQFDLPCMTPKEFLDAYFI